MQVAVIISSPVGWPALLALANAGGVAAVAVPRCLPVAETEQLAQQAAALGLPVTRLTREQLAADLLAWLAPLAATAVLVFTLPWRIPAEVLAVPPQGFLNFHLAPLPAYRGPEPLFWLLRNGATMGAVTVHRMDAGFDTGPVVVAEPAPIGPGDTHGLYRARLATLAAPVALRLLESLRTTGLPARVQVEEKAQYWPRPGLTDVCVNWTEPAAAIDRLVRATNPWNRGALTTLRGQPLRLLGITPHPHAATGPATPGMVLHADAAAGLWVACGAGEALRLDIVALDEGYFTGLQLLQLGVGCGEVLGGTALSR